MAPQNFIYKPTWVANTFLQRARDEGVRDIDPLKIQKLVYNFHGWHLAITACPAIGERFEAWPHGPVLSSLYHQFKNNRWMAINHFAKDIDPITGEEKALLVPTSDEQFTQIFHHVWNRYKSYSGVELSALTHAAGTPWTKARESGQQYISDEEIRRHFVELGQRGVTSAA